MLNIHAMKAIRLHSPAPVETNPLLFEEIALPQPEPGQVRIKVAMCGVCHTDLHITEGEIHPLHLPIIPGHQVVGVIDADPWCAGCEYPGFGGGPCLAGGRTLLVLVSRLDMTAAAGRN